MENDSTSSIAKKKMVSGRNVPRTRDSSGKYIPGSNSVYLPKTGFNAPDCEIRNSRSLGSTPIRKVYLNEPVKTVYIEDGVFRKVPLSTMTTIVDDDEENGCMKPKVTKWETSCNLPCCRGEAFCTSSTGHHDDYVEQQQSKSSKKDSSSCSSQDIVRSNRSKQRQKRGYESFCFTLSAPIDVCCSVQLPLEWNYRSIHVENAFVQTNGVTFRDTLQGACCNNNYGPTNEITRCNTTNDADKTLNEIRFTEGLWTYEPELRLTTGGCFRKQPTISNIEFFELLNPRIGGNGSNIVEGFTRIKVSVQPCNLLREGEIVFLLESQKIIPEQIQFWPFRVVESSCSPTSNEMILEPTKPIQSNRNCGTRVSSSLCDPSMVGALSNSNVNERHNPLGPVLIPVTFSPTTILVLPLMGEECIAKAVSDDESSCCRCVTWNCETGEYEVQEISESMSNNNCDKSVYTCNSSSVKPNGRSFTTQKILAAEGDYYISRISSRKYHDGFTLAKEIQRCMNPPLVSHLSGNLRINGTLIVIPPREYKNATQLAQSIQNAINSTLGWWNNPTCEVRVNYDTFSGSFCISRSVPFRLEFLLPPNPPPPATDAFDIARTVTLAELLGFSGHQVYVGNRQYNSNFPIYYVSNVSCSRRCLGAQLSNISSFTENFCNPSNRYLCMYDVSNDLLTVSAVSKTDYLAFLQTTTQPTPPSMMIGSVAIDSSWYEVTPCHNFAVPFAFCSDSPLTNFLGFYSKCNSGSCFPPSGTSCITQDWISSIGVSSLLSPPPILYLMIPELENDIKVALPPDCIGKKGAIDRCCPTGRRRSDQLCDNGRTITLSSAMAILYLESNGRTYKTQNSLGCNDMTRDKNIRCDNIKMVTFLFYTETGTQYHLNDSRGVVNLKLTV